MLGADFSRVAAAAALAGFGLLVGLCPSGSASAALFGAACDPRVGSAGIQYSLGVLGPQDSMEGCNGQAVADSVQDLISPAGNAYYFEHNAQTTWASSAGLGSLRAASTSSATSSPASWTFQYPPAFEYIENMGFASASSSASAGWFDTITQFPGASLGQAVLLSLTMNVSGVVSSFQSGGLAAGFSAHQPDVPGSFISLNLTSPGSANTSAFFQAGYPLVVSGALSVQTAVTSGWSFLGFVPMSQATADAGNTASFYIDVQTLGVGYETASGASYATPIPEPTTALLLALALLGMSAVRLKR